MISCESLQIKVATYRPLLVVCLIIFWSAGLRNAMGIIVISKKCVDLEIITYQKRK